MGLLILGIVLSIGFYFLFGIYIDTCNGWIKWKPNKKQFLGLFGLIIIFCSCLKSVPTGHTGIVTTFGKVEDITLDAGIHFIKPWQKVIKMDNRTQKQELSLSCFSSDIQEVTVTYTVNYQIEKANAQNIYKNIGTDYFNVVVKPKVLEALKGVFAKYTAESLVSERGTLSEEIEEVLVTELDGYNIEIIATSLEDIDFTDAFTTAVEEKQVAQQNKLKAETEQERLNLEAQAAAERAVISAQATADSALIAANNEAAIVKIQADSAEYQGQKDAAIMEAIGAKLSAYPDLVDYYYLQSWDGKLPTTMLSDDTNVLMGIE